MVKSAIDALVVLVRELEAADEADMVAWQYFAINPVSGRVKASLLLYRCYY